ncbi:hypothetical protein FRC19_005566 [Serendipita sp. 401]|nr:hypothetical protein FRC19_005566 [Serendipita sp. 401]
MSATTTASPPQLDVTPVVSVLSLFSLQGKTALVTGASRGIGAAIAIALSQAGAHVILHYRSPQTSTTTYDTILKEQQQHQSANGENAEAEKPASIVYADLSSKSDTKSLFDSALSVLAKDTNGKRNRIDILVHAAGIQRRSPAVDFGDEEWEEVINVNLSSAFYLARAAARHMLATPFSSSSTTNQTGGSGGKIILLGSLLTFQGGLTVPAYASAKGGIGQLTKALSNEWSKLNINVNCVCPGYIDTDMNEALMKDQVRKRQIEERIPAGRWGRPWDFAGPVVWLASEASKYVCGECVVVDGGWMGR